ncbi:hypothetical protein FVO59_01675 [Microbacterium esteraromaticum]|uniref:Uncharacterized protein n=1 Tax=Microbacterium esteraromaticum TaxID=57043 RepID=A0A7D8AHT4_9MICO|nr:hypothetical protein [Microbacterium esteraromaticum]QMU96049.1 hypothetical protein FVO59_01675 [Microbacterium esteraromaticum]
MTASHTLPLPIIAPVHEHGWVTESAHRTSEGEVAYVRCIDCGARRVDLRAPQGLAPTAQSRAISAARR